MLGSPLSNIVGILFSVFRDISTKVFRGITLASAVVTFGVFISITPCLSSLLVFSMWLPQKHSEPAFGPPLGGTYDTSNILSRSQRPFAAWTRAPELSVEISQHVPFPPHCQRKGRLLLRFPEHTFPDLSHTTMSRVVVLGQIPVVCVALPAKLADARCSEYRCCKRMLGIL